jgi:hypothetical protein
MKKLLLAGVAVAALLATSSAEAADKLPKPYWGKWHPIYASEAAGMDADATVTATSMYGCKLTNIEGSNDGYSVTSHCPGTNTEGPFLFPILPLHGPARLGGG